VENQSSGKQRCNHGEFMLFKCKITVGCKFRWISEDICNAPLNLNLWEHCTFAISSPPEEGFVTASTPKVTILFSLHFQSSREEPVLSFRHPNMPSRMLYRESWMVYRMTLISPGV
jgi:hypothetical protein